jgi:hypothetical protein
MAILLDSSGNIVLDADGNIRVGSDGDPCCCSGEPEYCCIEYIAKRECAPDGLHCAPWFITERNPMPDGVYPDGWQVVDECTIALYVMIAKGEHATCAAAVAAYLETASDPEFPFPQGSAPETELSRNPCVYTYAVTVSRTITRRFFTVFGGVDSQCGEEITASYTRSFTLTINCCGGTDVDPCFYDPVLFDGEGGGISAGILGLSVDGEWATAPTASPMAGDFIFYGSCPGGGLSVLVRGELTRNDDYCPELIDDPPKWSGFKSYSLGSGGSISIEEECRSDPIENYGAVPCNPGDPDPDVRTYVPGDYFRYEAEVEASVSITLISGPECMEAGI